MRNFVITIRYEIPTFSSVWPFLKRGRGSKKIWPEAEILGIFSMDLAPKFVDEMSNVFYLLANFNSLIPYLGDPKG